jgi:AcrR family transcriptional regulator
MAALSRTNSEHAERARRSYRSPLRNAQAQETRRRIVDAAARCFRERGYSGTTVAQIAREASVSPESVAANGPKAALLLAAFEVTFTGREGTDPVSAREEMGRMLAIDDDDALLRAFADFALAIQRGGIGMWRALQDAASLDAGVEAMYRDLMERRRADHEQLAAALVARGTVRTDRTIAQLGASLALLSGFDPYQLMVRDFGWTDEEYLDWWVDSARRLLLP